MRFIPFALSVYVASSWHSIDLVNRNNLDASVLNDIVFDEVTTESFGTATPIEIGWKKVMWCNAGSYWYKSPYGRDNNENWKMRFIGGSDEDDRALYYNLAPYAISFKITPDPLDNPTQQQIDDFALYGKKCSIATIELNNVRSLPSDGHAAYYWAATDAPVDRTKSQGSAGLDFKTGNILMTTPYAQGTNFATYSGGQNVCSYTGAYDPLAPTDRIAMYFGFDKNKQTICSGVGSGLLTIDPCAGVTCPDTGNPCTDDICDGGQCITRAKVQGTSCDDTNLCNGNEACDGNGQCQPGIDVSCPFGEQCVTESGLCKPQCTAFDIDTFVGVCSSDIAKKNEVDQNRANIAALDAGLSSVNARIDGLTLNIPSQSSSSSNLPFMDLLNKDTLIVVLLVINMFLFCFICYGQQKKSNLKYKSVAVYSSEDEQKPINNL